MLLIPDLVHDTDEPVHVDAIISDEPVSIVAKGAPVDDRAMLDGLRSTNSLTSCRRDSSNCPFSPHKTSTFTRRSPFIAIMLRSLFGLVLRRHDAPIGSQDTFVPGLDATETQLIRDR